MIRPLFSWLAGRQRTGQPSTATPADRAGSVTPAAAPDAAYAVPTESTAATAATRAISRATTDVTGPTSPTNPTGLFFSGIEAGRREVQALEALRHVRFESREEAALHTQLARAPRDINALFGLLQLHVRRGDAKQAETFAHALWDETDAQGALWMRAAALCRTIDPDNPLYSDDPFTALAEHAASQPAAQTTLPLSTFDLSLPDHGAAASLDTALSGLASDLGAFGASGDLGGGDGGDGGDALAYNATSQRGTTGRPGQRLDGTHDRAQAQDDDSVASRDVGKSVFDYLNGSISTESLPASFAGLTLDLDDLPPSEAPDAAQAAERTLRLFSGRSARPDIDLSDAPPHRRYGSALHDAPDATIDRASDVADTLTQADAVAARSPVRMKYTKYAPARRARGRKKSRK